MSFNVQELDTLTNVIIGGAIEVHRHLGPGLLESTYENCLKYELSLRKLSFESQKAIPISYKSILLECGYRLDLIVENRVIIEIKSVAEIMPIHEAQVLSYLKLCKGTIGLLIS